MLADVHSAIQRLVYEHGGTSADEVDVRFEPHDASGSTD